MADIIGSGDLEPKRTMQEFRQIVQCINEQSKYLLSPLTITLGDEFQGVCHTISDGLATIIAIEELILKSQCSFRLRYVLFNGLIKTPVNTVSAYEMLGEGLTSARSHLQNLKKTDDRFFIFLGGANDLQETRINAAFGVMQYLIGQWHSKDYKAVAAFLEYGDYKQVAEVLGVDPSTAWRRKRSLGINAYLQMKSIILAWTKLTE